MIAGAGIFMSLIELKMVSELRPDTSSAYVLILLFLGFGFVATAVVFKPGILGLMARSYVQLEPKTFSRENVPLLEAPGILLVLNYLVSVTLLFQFLLKNATENFEFIYLLPLAWVAWTFAAAFISSAVIGETKSVTNYFSISLLSFEFIGVFSWFIALLYTIYPSIQNNIWIVIGAMFAIDIIWRYLKIAYNLHAQGLSWYYLILYFCTLEIVPLFVVYSTLLVDFARN